MLQLLESQIHLDSSDEFASQETCASTLGSFCRCSATDLSQSEAVIGALPRDGLPMATRLFTRRLAEISDETDGIVTRQQLFAEYFDHNDVQDGIVRGLLVPVFRGTYAVSCRTLTPRMLDRVATTHFATAMIVGRSAAERRGLLKLRPGVVHIATTKRRTTGAIRTWLPMRHDGNPGLIAFRPASVIRSTIVDGLPFAAMTRMLTDVAAGEAPWMLERCWKQADYLKLLDLAEVRRDLDASHRPGSQDVKALLEQHPGRERLQPGQATPTEFDFLQLIIEAGLPVPEVNVPMVLAGERYVGDFFWEDLGLVAELDDPSHERPLARRSDTLRDADFSDADLDVIRFDTEVVALDPDSSMRRLAAAIAHQQRRRNAPDS